MEIPGDIFEAPVQYIAHQCNCVTNRAKGLAENIFRRIPESDVYRDRVTPDKPGTITVKSGVINMFAQYYAGKPRFANDTKEIRLRWFACCLRQISEMKDIRSVAFPYRIGCNLAGGDWEKYRQMIENFSSENPKIKVLIVRKE